MRWRGIYLFTALFLALYSAWHLLPSLPPAQSDLGAVVQSPLGAVAAFLAWRASRRARGAPRLRRAWLLIALALAAQEAGSLFELAAELVNRELPYPSGADILYLSFYPVMLAGILSFPTLRRSARQKLELAIDSAIVGLCGGAAFVYFVLGPHALEGRSFLEAAVTLAYPVADTVLIVALAAALLGSPLPSLRTSLHWLIAAICLLIFGDLFWGYAVLHEAYDAESVLNIAYEFSTACFIVAAVEQRPATAEVAPRAAEQTRNAWLPYLAIAATIAIFLRIEIGAPFFPEFLIGAITALVIVLIVARQFVSLRSLRQGRARLAEAQGLAQLGSWEWDTAADRVEFSDEGARLLGLDSGARMTFGEAVELIEPEDREMVLRRLDAAAEEQRGFVFEMRMRRADGETRSFVSRAEVEVKSGAVARFQGTIQDVTDRKRMEALLQYQADHDPLTGLFNRRRFGEELERTLRFTDRYGHHGAMLMIDLDHFKTVNDTHGHAVGDRVLKGVAAAMSSRARETDILARFGGDEFAIVLPQATVDDARRVAEEIRAAVSRLETTPKLSIGIGPFDGRDNLVTEDILVAADMALYEAKDTGRDRVVVYSGRAGGAMSWVERIRAALEEDRFLLYAQPMMDVASGRIDHHELLIRMVDESGEVISPDAFLPTAERIGLITEIDRWVVAAGLRLAREGRRVSINLAAPSIGDAQVLEEVRTAVAGGVDAGGLIFEITETAAMSNMQSARSFVEALRELGCGVALDDFGTGFGSFTYLKHLPSSHLKIDMEFVSHMHESATDRQVVRSITEVAHSLGKQIVAEGVEDEATLATLREYGVDCAQGFYIGRPVPVTPAPDAAPLPRKSTISR